MENEDELVVGKRKNYSKTVFPRGINNVVANVPLLRDNGSVPSTTRL
jgi:hypothetical protein